MNKILLVFDYFKEAFHLNKQNKALYAPQLALIAVKVLLIVFVGIGLYSWIGIANINKLFSMQAHEILSFGISQGIKVLSLILVYSIINVTVEAGLLNMYKQAVSLGHIEGGAFKEGLSKYFIKLLVGEVLVAACYILSFPFYLLIGLVTLTIGLTIIPILAGIFLSMWKVSLVMKDNGVLGSIKDSFSFAKRNFWPLAFLQVIHLAFVNGFGNRSGSANFNFPNNPGGMTGSSFIEQPGVQEALQQIIPIFKIAIAVLIPVTALATIGASAIVMIFEVFFTLALFIAYNKNFQVEKALSETIEASEFIEGAGSPTNEEAVLIDDDIDTIGNEEVEQ